MAGSDTVALPRRGETFPATRQPGLLGAEKWFPNVLTPNAEPRDQRLVRMRWVKNASGQTLNSAQGVRLDDDDDFGKQIADGTDAAEHIDGIVDHCIDSTGVIDGNACWIAVGPGPHRVISDGATALARGDIVAASGSTDIGEVELVDQTPSSATTLADQLKGKVGVVEDATVTNVAHTKFWCRLDVLS